MIKHLLVHRLNDAILETHTINVSKTATHVGFGFLLTNAVAQQIRRQQAQHLFDLIAVTPSGLFHSVWNIIQRNLMNLGSNRLARGLEITKIMLGIGFPYITLGLGYIGKPFGQSVSPLMLVPFIAWIVTVLTLAIIYVFDLVLVLLLSLTMVTTERMTAGLAVFIHVVAITALTLLTLIFHALGWRSDSVLFVGFISVAALVLVTALCEVIARMWWRWLMQNGTFHPNDTAFLMQGI